jgi:hypothetical protein
MLGNTPKKRLNQITHTESKQPNKTKRDILNNNPKNQKQLQFHYVKLHETSLSIPPFPCRSSPLQIFNYQTLVINNISEVNKVIYHPPNFSISGTIRPWSASSLGGQRLAVGRGHRSRRGHGHDRPRREL